MSALITSQTLLPYGHVAQAAGLEAWALRRLEPDDFRGPENCREVGEVCYLTVAGVRVLAERLKRRGYAIKAHALTVLANQHEGTPARGLIAPQPKNMPPARPAWLNRVDAFG